MSGEGCSVAEGGEANEREEEPREPKRIVVGICAMDKKVEAPPMQNILQRLQCHSYMCVVVFTDAVILHRPVEEWPLCDCLIAFYSSDFPLDKAIDYVKLRRPYVMNNLEMQYTLQNRKKVYEVLTESGVEVPRYAVLERKEGGDKVEMSETDDTVEIDGQVFNKPFVEKPLSAEDHRVYIYFPADLGGGCQQLFRKVNNRSSKFSKESTLRQSGSFIYEEFMATDGIDVKVYTVGPDYAHAEARKSPALDGRVERDLKGKEKRYPVILTPQEKIIARKVSLGFKQTVCGFDLLRANGKSYVCDVNGFSFVKNSQKYYDDCAQIVLEMITKELAPDNIPSIPPSLEYIAEDVPVPIPPAKDSLELRCVIGVIRHGDRTPKQKMKMLVTHKKFFDLFDELGGYKTGRLKLKKPKKLQRVLDIARYLLLTMDKPHNDYETEKAIHKLQQLRNVLEMYGHFSGINRKVQFKLITKKPGKDGRDRDLLLLILKWGGELTPVGERQAEELGRAFRCMYPGGEGEYASLPGSGFLRLHSTYRHDLKVYASDEGRVQMTAAAFTKGLLDLEGSFASVLVHLVKRGANATSMLDAYSHTQDRFERVKEEVHELLQSSGDVTESMLQKLAPTGAQSLVEAIKAIKNPQEACERLYSMIKELAGELKRIKQSGRQVKLCHSETMEMMLNRWGKLVKDFKLKNGTFEISKIPDIYDCIKYDLLHNSCLGLKVGKSLYSCSMHLADVVIPQEYGKTVEEKLEIASNICNPLLRKIQADLQHTIDNEYSDIIHRLDPLLSRGVVSPKRHVRTRLYFTSESHVHTLLNVLRYGEGLVESPKDSMWTTAMDKVSRSPELNYMTQIVFLLFEDTKQALNSAKRFQVEVHFSPGVKGREILLQGEDSSSVRPPDLSKALSARVLRAPVVRMAAAELHVSSMSKSSPFIGRKVSDLVTLRSSSDTTLQVLAKRKTSVDSAKSQMLSCHDMAEEDLEEQEEAGSVHSKDHIYFELEGALELAAELEAVEPLIPLCVVPLNKMDQFLCRMTGVEDDVDKAPSLLSSLGDNMFFNETVPSS